MAFITAPLIVVPLSSLSPFFRFTGNSVMAKKSGVGGGGGGGANSPMS